MLHSYCPTWQIKPKKRGIVFCELCFDYALLDVCKTRGYRIEVCEETGDYILAGEKRKENVPNYDV